MSQKVNAYVPRFSPLGRSIYFLLSFLILLYSTTAAQEKAGTIKLAQDVRALELGKPIERELKTGEVHVYQIKVKKGDYVHVVVDQRGIDIIATLLRPDGTEFDKFDSYYRYGAETISIIAAISGSYKLQVFSSPDDSLKGRYQLRIKELRKATPQDESLIAATRTAQKLFKEGERLRKQGKADSLQKALEIFEETLLLCRMSNDRQREAHTLSRIGLVYEAMNKKQKTIEYHLQALPLYQAIGDTFMQATCLSGIGAGYVFSLGQHRESLDYLFQALPLLRRTGNLELEAVTLSSLAAAYFSLGEIQKAVDYGQQALVLFRNLGKREQEAALLPFLGAIYNLLGQTKIAEDYLSQGQRLSSQLQAGASLKEKNLIAARRAHTEGYQFLMKDTAESLRRAIEKYNEALRLYRIAEDRQMEATMLMNVGALYLILGEKEKTIDDLEKSRGHFAEALPLFQALADRRGEVGTLAGIGEAYYWLGDKEKALVYLGQGLPLSRKIGMRGIEATVLYNIARLKRDNGKLIDARTKIESALGIIDSMRTNVANSELRASYFGSVLGLFKAYEFYIDLLMRLHQSRLSKGHDAEAFQASERFRARSLLEILAVPQPQPLNVKEIQGNVLDNTTVLLEYALGEENSYLWAVTKNECLAYKLPPLKEVVKKVESYLAVIAPNPANSPKFDGKNLYDVLLNPASKALQRKTNLIIVPDGILHYLPFEALVSHLENDAPQYLIESFNISYSPSASVLGLVKSQKRISAQKNRRELLAFGDPIFGDETTTAKRDTAAPDTTAGDTVAVEFTERGLYEERGFKFNRLQHTAAEIEKIAARIPIDKKQIYLRAEAKEERAKAERLNQYRILHFATHGVLDEQTPDRSSIVLTLDNDPAEDGFLQMKEIFNLKLDADLVVLSACQTGKGKLLRGEGVIGMARAFMYAGARSLVVSLWPVNDRSTADFMASFYGYMQRDKAKNEALRQAKLDMIKSADAALRHPYFWAPFVLMGENK
jgi:CHAT domain-containing protein